jgi:hypothetical protein
MARDPSDDKPFRPVKINHVSIVRGSAAAAAKTGGSVKKPANSTTKTPAAPK